jgi:hypothetical protein
MAGQGLSPPAGERKRAEIFLRAVTEVACCFVSAPMPWNTLRRFRRLLPFWLGLALVCTLCGGVLAAENTRRTYELPGGDAATMLRELSAISGREILFAAEVVRGVRTNPLRGEFTPIEAVSRLLAGTVLSVVQDEKTGALAVRRQKHPPENPASPRSGR